MRVTVSLLYERGMRRSSDPPAMWSGEFDLSPLVLASSHGMPVVCAQLLSQDGSNIVRILRYASVLSSATCGFYVCGVEEHIDTLFGQEWFVMPCLEPPTERHED